MERACRFNRSRASLPAMPALHPAELRALVPVQRHPRRACSRQYGKVSEDTLGSTSVLVSKTFNKHSFRVGFDGNLTRYNVQNQQSGFGTFLFNRQFTQKNSVSTALAVMQAQGTLSPLCCWAILRADPTQTRWPMRFSNSTTASMCRMTGAS